jgi:gliding motility-associated protein GldM
MGGGKETPRQKMIGMMYLVLTALLAMNVSKTVLLGYIRVNEGMERSRNNLTENNKRITEAFQKSLDGNPAAKPYFERSKEAAKLFDEMIEYIEKVKKNVYVHNEKFEDPKMADTLQLKWTVNGGYDNYDIPTHVLLGADERNPSKEPLTAGELKMKIEELQSKLVAMVEKMQKTDGEHLFPEDYTNLKKKLEDLKPHASGEMEDGVPMSWEMENFYHLPEAAVIANLTKFQVDIKNAQSEILQVFSSASGKLSIKPDRLVAGVIAPSSYIQAGQPYEADIFLSAAFTKLAAGDMEVMLGIDSLSAAKGGKGNSIDIVNGVGKYKVGTGSVGDQTYKGVIKFKKPDGTFMYYPFEKTYKVAPPSVAVTAEQMNVFYAGVDNPVSVAAAGVAPADIVISASGAGNSYVSTGPGKYMFKFTTPGECIINVSSKGPGGVKPQGLPNKFRVKPLPKPDLKIGGKFGVNEMKKGDLGVVGALGAGAQGFDFQANYLVTEWEISGLNARDKYVSVKGTGSSLNADAKGLLSAPKVNSKIYFEAKVKGPDGKVNSVAQPVKVIK